MDDQAIRDAVPPVQPPAAAPETLVPPASNFGKLWPRVFAFIVDGLFVSLCIVILAIPFFTPLSRLGPWGHLVGFFLTLPYFALLNSRIGNGQTLGKRWMRLRVVDANGSTITLSRATLRYAVLQAPFFLNGATLPSRFDSFFLDILLAAIIVGLGGGTLYLIFFNRPSRQGFHDLAAGTYVVSAESSGPVTPHPVRKYNWIILGSSCAVIVVGAAFAVHFFTHWGALTSLQQDAAVIETIPGVQSAGVMDLHQWTNGTLYHILDITVRVQNPSIARETFARSAVTTLFQHDPTALQYDQIRVTIVRGYDLGIAHAQVTRNYSGTPAQWQKHPTTTEPARSIS